MSFLGLRKWPTPARLFPPRLCYAPSSHIVPSLPCIVKPLWPFMAAGTITAYLILKAQESGIRSEQWRNDPRNPYAAELAKESLH
ncbi:LOW QUALITY PROTEIN: hypothetical protein CVT26_002645 [Gymnopilus dilepis]|uniref:Uncharacterized protein n=1 Tax=Gymnopilus dilepis TaxID=231916 RepID=A0A409VCI7_9AGAR|nr:LOW QUALITY PROTEIN: hypothetical protein CVT26_002645 [Gymnopilus dilepis]